MKLDPSIIKAGLPGICSATEWNKFAKAINTIWSSRATQGVTLTKGEPWRLSVTTGVSDEIIGTAGCMDGHCFLRIENPRIPGPNDDPNVCALIGNVSLLIPDSVGASHPVSLRFRGVTERKGYTGGDLLHPFRTGGTPIGGGENVWRLKIIRVGEADRVYYFNASAWLSGPFNDAGVVAYDYLRTVEIAGGDVLALYFNSIDRLQYDNTGLIIPGIPPDPAAFDGQFMQIDFDP